MTTPIILATISAVLVMTAAIVPATANGASGAELWFLSLPAIVALLASLGWIVQAAARPVRAWVMPLAIVAVWGLLVGGLVIASNLSAWNHYADQARAYSELAVEDHAPGSKGGDSRDREQDRYEARINEAKALEMVHLARFSLLWGAVLLTAGAFAGFKAIKLRQAG